MQSKKYLFWLFIGEIAVGILTVLAYIGLSKFNWTVISGICLGIVTALFYYIFLDISIGRITDKIEAERGNKELTEEEQQAFIQENQKKIQAKMQSSFYLRICIILIVFTLAFLTNWFAVFATIIPMLAVSPILMVIGYFSKEKTANG